MGRPSGANENEIAELVGWLTSRSQRRLDHARSRLTMLGARAVPPLIEALDDDDARLRARAIPLLALIQDPSGRDPLIARLQDGSPRVREVAARGLARFPCNASSDALEDLLDTERRQSIRVTAVHTLVEIAGAGIDRPVACLVSTLSDRRQPPRVRIAAMNLIRELGARQREGFLERLADDEDPLVRRSATRLRRELSRQGPSRSKLQAEIDRLGAEDYAVWNGAVQHLVRRGSRAVPALVDAMRSRDHDPEFCTRVGMVIRGLGPRRASGLLDLLPEVNEPLPLQVLVEAIGSLDSARMVYGLKELIDRLDQHEIERDEVPGALDPMQRVRARAHLELARRGSRLAIDDLRRALGDPERRIELEMIAAVEFIGNREEIVPLLRAYGCEDRLAREHVRRAVRAIVDRERIRRNDPLFRGLSRAEKRALAAILPPPAAADPRIRASRPGRPPTRRARDQP